MRAFNLGKNMISFESFLIFFRIKIKNKIKSAECYCGNTYGSYGTASSRGKSCNMACPNKTTDICGGAGVNSVYMKNCTSIRSLFLMKIGILIPR